MATVSELSMYQATAMKLQQEKHEAELSVQDANWRLEQGQPPNEEAELEWERYAATMCSRAWQCSLEQLRLQDHAGGARPR